MKTTIHVWLTRHIWVLPLAQGSVCVLNFLTSLMFERHIRIKQVYLAARYFASIPRVARGDILDYLDVCSIP